MKDKLICYEVRDITPSKRRTLHRKLYGYKDHSNRGQYIYERSGLLKEVEGKKIIDAVLLVESEEATRKVTGLLHKYEAKTYVFNVLSETES